MADKNTEQDINYSKIKLWVPILVALGVIILWGISWPVISKHFGQLNMQGTFGDSFGAVNALFSGLAFGGVIYTIILQSRELRLQREELRETRQEFKIQNNTLKLQQFENTFFNLLKTHHDIVNSMSWNALHHRDLINNFENELRSKVAANEGVFNGREVFNVTYELLKDIKFEGIQKHSWEGDYMACYELVRTNYGHYYRNLYRLIKFVDENDLIPLSQDIRTSVAHPQHQQELQYLKHLSKYKYTCIIRSQLSDYELKWLFYNGLSELGKKFKGYIERYSLLKNLDNTDLHDSSWTSNENYYDSSAYNPNKIKGPLIPKDYYNYSLHSGN